MNRMSAVAMLQVPSESESKSKSLAPMYSPLHSPGPAFHDSQSLSCNSYFPIDLSASLNSGSSAILAKSAVKRLQACLGSLGITSVSSFRAASAFEAASPSEAFSESEAVLVSGAVSASDGGFLWEPWVLRVGTTLQESLSVDEVAVL